MHGFVVVFIYQNDDWTEPISPRSPPTPPPPTPQKKVGTTLSRRVADARTEHARAPRYGQRAVGAQGPMGEAINLEMEAGGCKRLAC